MFRRNGPVARNALTPEGREVLERSDEEARRLRHAFVGPEHLMLALLAEHGQPEAILRDLGVEPESVAAAIAHRHRRGSTPSPKGRLPYTSWMKKVIERAMTEARERGDAGVSPAHMILALLLVAPRDSVLHGLAVDANRARIAYERAAALPRHGRADRAPRLAIRIDDASPMSIYEQLVAQVQEAVATGVVRAGERLPTVRQLADQLDIAPGTVARAYGELERLSVVVTDGARGTRVAEREIEGETLRRPETLVGLLRPVAVAAFHLGASADELRTALERAMQGIFVRPDAA